MFWSVNGLSGRRPLFDSPYLLYLGIRRPISNEDIYRIREQTAGYQDGPLRLGRQGRIGIWKRSRMWDFALRTTVLGEREEGQQRGPGVLRKGRRNQSSCRMQRMVLRGNLRHNRLTLEGR